MADRYFLTRFRNAQDFGVYETALKEVRKGKKTGHWMWFVFPQITGLGQSHNSRYYSIKSISEAKEYLADPILGSRLREICGELLKLDSSDPAKIFGFPDWMKLGSCMTLFDYVEPNDLFSRVLNKFFSGSRDLKSISIIRNLNNSSQNTKHEVDQTGN